MSYTEFSNEVIKSLNVVGNKNVVVKFFSDSVGELKDITGRMRVRLGYNGLMKGTDWGFTGLSIYSECLKKLEGIGGIEKVDVDHYALGFDRGFGILDRIVGNRPRILAGRGSRGQSQATFEQRPGVFTTEEVKRYIGADIANEQGYTGKGKKLAVCDTGFGVNRQLKPSQVEDFSVANTPSTKAEKSGHGTWCLTAAGGKRVVLGNGSVIEGVAQDCQLMSVKCLFTPTGIGFDSGIMKAWTISKDNGAEFFSNSLGGEYATEEGSIKGDMIRALTEQGIIVGAAAGNSGDEPGTVNSPGDIEECFTVGAFSMMDEGVSSFSSRGPTADGRIKPDVVVPGGGRAVENPEVGEALLSSSAGLIDLNDAPDRLAAIAGTSMATPIAMGLVVLMAEKYEKVVGEKFDRWVLESVISSGREKSNEDGYGLMTWQWFEEWL